MGYTHYFTQKRNLKVSEMEALANATAKIIRATNVPVIWEYDEPGKPPEITKDLIRFNGVGDDGHETFWLPRQRPKREAWQDKDTHGFLFCKTARKPYDIIVVAVLCAAHRIAPGAFAIGSDGDAEDWDDGLALFNRVATGQTAMLPLAMSDLQWFTPEIENAD